LPQPAKTPTVKTMTLNGSKRAGWKNVLAFMI
jgi:hypothetical protein